MDELYKQYISFHNNAANGCKTSCGTMEFSEVRTSMFNGDTAHTKQFIVRAGVYCIAPVGRWEIIGSGATEQQCIHNAHITLLEWEKEWELAQQQDKEV